MGTLCSQESLTALGVLWCLCFDRDALHLSDHQCVYIDENYMYKCLQYHRRPEDWPPCLASPHPYLSSILLTLLPLQPLTLISSILHDLYYNLCLSKSETFINSCPTTSKLTSKEAEVEKAQTDPKILILSVLATSFNHNHRALLDHPSAPNVRLQLFI